MPKPKKAVKKATKKTVAKKTTKKVAKKATKKPTSIKKHSPLGHLLVEKLLREAGFKGQVSTDKEVLKKFSTDQSIFCIKPQVVLQPKSKKDIEIAVSVVNKELERFPSLSLTPRGAGTGVSGGSLTDSIVLDTKTFMDKISIEKKGKDVLITCGPGAVWGVAEKKLKKYGTYFPTAPASKDFSTIGGAVGNNAAGSDTLRYGHTANWIESLDVVLNDGKTYEFRAINYTEYKALIKKKNAFSTILQEVFALIEKNEKVINAARPKTTKNTAGYQLWDVFDDSIANFKKGKGKMRLTRLITGSQGSLGIVSSITMRTLKRSESTELISIPVFDLPLAGKIIFDVLKYDPLNVELFDGLTFQMALKNPDFFKRRIEGMEYYKAIVSLYKIYHITYGGKMPEFVLLVTLDKDSLKKKSSKEILKSLQKNYAKNARLVTSPSDVEILWQLRRGGFPLSKYEAPNKIPAAFLEDMIVPPAKLSDFFKDVKSMLKKYDVIAAVHGHGGNGHLHFYPLLDFEDKKTPKLIETMTEEFFNTAIKYGGSFCGEHNDGIIRTPHLSKMFNKKTLQLFVDVEHIFDPNDIFNPGKKVNPRFNVIDHIRRTN